MTPVLDIAGRLVGAGHPVYVVAEMSANHNGDFDRAVEIVRAAAVAGADAVKIQTYTADTMTLDADQEAFRIGDGSLWSGETLFELYSRAQTPWDWFPKLRAIAHGSGIELFSSPFDATAVDFLEDMDAPVYKIASFEIVDIPLLKKVAETGKPVIVSTGMANQEEIDDAVAALRAGGAKAIALLRCTSAYPAEPQDMHLRTIPYLAERYGVVPGLSDHTMGSAAAVASVSLGGCIIEKHFTLSREDGGPDAPFSMEPHEFAAMVLDVRQTELALGRIQTEPLPTEAAHRALRRSLFVVEDVKAGDVFTELNVRSIRPGAGLPPKHFWEVLGKKAARDIMRGTPLAWGDVLGYPSKF